MFPSGPAVFEVSTVAPRGPMQLHAASCIPRFYLKGFYAAFGGSMRPHATPFGSMQLHAARCIFRLYLKGLHAALVVFEVYTLAPWGSMQLHAAPVVFEGTANINKIYPGN